MSGGMPNACICPADACFVVKDGAYCKHAGKVLANFVDRWGKRFAAYVHPDTEVGETTPTGARCTSIDAAMAPTGGRKP